MLSPSYFLLPKEYYTRKQLISNGIKEKYQQYQTRFQFDNAEYYIRYTNEDIYAYITRAFQFEYDRLFTNNGERKRQVRQVKCKGAYWKYETERFTQYYAVFYR